MHCFRTPRLWTWGRLFVAPHLKPKTGGDIYPIRNSQAFQVSFQVVTVIWVGRLIMENVFPLPWQPVPPFTCPVYSWCIPNLFIIGIHKKVLKKILVIKKEINIIITPHETFHIFIHSLKFHIIVMNSTC